MLSCKENLQKRVEVKVLSAQAMHGVTYKDSKPE